MAIFAVPRVTWEFVDGVTGWSETMYNKTLQDSDLLATQAFAVASKRGDMLGTQSTLNGIRLSDAANPRTTRLLKVAYPNRADIKFVPKFGNSDTPWNTALFRGNADNNTYHRSLEISGMPDEVVNDPAIGFFPAANIPGPQSDWLDVAAAWIKQVIKSGFGMLAASRDVAVAPQHPITIITLAAGVATVTCPAHGFATNDQVIIEKVSPRSFNGRYRVTVIDPNSFTINNVTFTKPWVAGGQARKLVMQIFNFDDISPVSFSHRSRGRPSTATRGRRLRKAKVR